MIQEIKAAAQEVGIKAVISNSKEGIETQLNSLTHREEKGDSTSNTTITRTDDCPILLISWDIDTTLSFSNGVLNNPLSAIVALLLKKSPDLKKQSLEDASEEMASLFHSFIQNLNDRLVLVSRTSTTPITNCGYKLVPRYGLGKHSGILARWNMISQLDVC